MADMDKVKVAVRVRPFNRREVELGTKCVVDMEAGQTLLHHPSTAMKESDVAISNKKAPKVFAFDHCFWSMEANNSKFASQEKVFQCLGQDILERAFEGYNACIFAYGQTGSGKSYSMMGTAKEKGIIPRLCDSLFERMNACMDNQLSFKVEVSYMEIYNEKVRDLLDPKGGKHNLRVREHNILGPYVDGLSTLAVSAFQDIDSLMSEGNKSRTVAATNMNSESSRSHAVFSIILNQTLTDLQTGVSGEKVSKMSLVDLAGSERAQKTGAVGERLKEGSNINKSLTTLGLVISALADSASKTKNKFVPYRDSVLTWLLKDNLGGNSKTVMIATLSPAADNYEETLSTLRYADRAKRIVNHAVVNEDPNARIIRELREEVESLRTMLKMAESMKAPDLQDRLEESEKLMQTMSKTWEQKLQDTERIHQERHAALEKMGISVQTSGIKVEKNKYYLVNLNADPSLNELLVYYLKEHTLVGRPDAPKAQDIQLSGLGIMLEHCILDMEDQDVFITPLDGARTCVNGCTITSKTRVKHGDRILWGNNHFFRINCPKANSPSAETPEQNIDYDFAQQELMMEQMGNDPIQEAITAIEKQHEDDKAEALEKQRQMYERQMQMLRNQLMSPSTPSQPYPPMFFDSFTKMTPSGAGALHPKYQQWAQEREKLFRQSLIRLKTEVVKANTLVRESNFLAEEMGKQTEFFVTLQIPAANLSPNRKRGAFVSEPAILVKRKGKGSQIWSMEKFENKIIDMRDMYEERKEKGLPLKVEEETIIRLLSLPNPLKPGFKSRMKMQLEQRRQAMLQLHLSDQQDAGAPNKGDPFYESQENHNLVGVANVFLEALFYDVKLNYHVPIISQQGEVTGRLHIELCRVSGSMPDRREDLDHNDSFESMEGEGIVKGSNIICRVSIKEARGLPPSLANFVFCQYNFWGSPEPIVVPPLFDPQAGGNSEQKRRNGIFQYDHTKEFAVHVTEEFMEHCAEGALSIEVWGHHSQGFSNLSGWEMDQVHAKSRSIMDRWTELTRKIELWLEIHELNDQGEYMPVEVLGKPQVLTGGVHQLRQGHSRRILVQVKPVQNSGTLPIICESITHVSIGGVSARPKDLKGLDSYQEEDLERLREKWTEALNKRRDYLDEQLQIIMNKEEKTDADVEREKSLVDQWVCLTEERNACECGSGIPGAPAEWEPPQGMEKHTPVIFLDLNADDMSTPNVKEGLQAAGVNSILPKEHQANFYTLPFVKSSEKDVCAVVSWDSSIHDSVHLNRLTPNTERVYLILKVVVRLSHPAAMELVLRKRLAINVYKRQSITDKLKKRISKSVIETITGSDYFQDSVFKTGVTYEIVSNIPKASEDLEDRESLAQMAASQNEAHTSDGETYIEKYIRGVSAVESILTLDRLRQEVAIKEGLAARGRPLRKATSVPNIQSILSSPRGLDEQARSDSTQDLSFGLNTSLGSLSNKFAFDAVVRPRSGSEDLSKDVLYGRDSAILPNKPGFNLARPNFLALRSNIYNSVTKPSPKAGVSPQPTKTVIRMKTLQEEQHVRETKPLLINETEDSDEDEFAKLKDAVKNVEGVGSPGSDDFQDFTSYQEGGQETGFPTTTTAPEQGMPHSATAECLADGGATKSFTPSMASSGYGSQAVSMQTLSSEDSSSVRSMSIEDTPDQEAKKATRPTSLDKVEARNDTVMANGEPEKPSLVKRVSLIDEDVPSNLGTPLQPFSPEDDADQVTVVEAEGILPSEDAAAEPAQPQTDTCEQPASEANAAEPATTDNAAHDAYSQDALESLESLGPAAEQPETPSESQPAQPPVQETQKTPKSKEKGRSPKATRNDNRRSSIEKAQRRRSWHDKSEHTSYPEEMVSPGKPEMKIRKSTSMDIGRGSLKKIRSGGDSRGGKTAPSPVKATYRPASMYGDQMVVSAEDLTTSDNSDTEDTMSICSFGSRADLHRLGEAPVPSWIQSGEPVLVLFSQGPSKPGMVQFVGHTEFASGNWVGVELDTPDGKNDGSVKGVRYFRCKSRHGIFVRHDKLIMDKKRKGAKIKSSTLRRSTGNLSSASPTKDGASPVGNQSFMRSTASSSLKHTK